MGALSLGLAFIRYPLPSFYSSRSIERANQTSEIQFVNEFLAHNIKVGAVDIDSQWSTADNNFIFDTTKYPNASAMIEYFHSINVRVVPPHFFFLVTPRYYGSHPSSTPMPQIIKKAKKKIITSMTEKQSSGGTAKVMSMGVTSNSKVPSLTTPIQTQQNGGTNKWIWC